MSTISGQPTAPRTAKGGESSQRPVFGEVLSLSENLRIEFPNGKIEHRCKGNPGPIRDQQNSGDRADLPEENYCNKDQNPEGENIDKCETSEFPSKENPTPEGV